MPAKRAGLVDRCREALSAGRPVAICAAPGMGKTTLCKQIALEYEQQRRVTDYRSLEGLEGRRLVAELRRVTRKVTRPRKSSISLMVFDDVPSLDDCDLERIRGCVTSMRKCGCATVLSFRPEAAQVLEFLSSPFVLSSMDLLVTSGEIARWDGCPDEEAAHHIAMLTGGIPLLVDEARHAALFGRQADSALPGLPEYLASCLRTSLMDEERRLRLAMLLMGKGSMEDVYACVGRVDLDTLRSLVTDEPILGLGSSLRSFCCPDAVTKGPLLAGCENAVRAAAPDLQETMVRVAALLLARGDARRAAFALRCCEDGAPKRDLVLEWPAELIECGELRLVRDVIRRADGSRDVDPDRFLLASSMVRSIDGDDAGARTRLAAVSPEGKGLRSWMQARALYVACLAKKVLITDDREDVICEDGLVGSGEGCSGDPLARAFLLHADVRVLVARGRVEEAYRRLLVGAARLDGNTFSSALLHEDMVLVGTLVGDMTVLDDASSEDSSTDFLMASGFGDQLVYQLAEREFLAGLAGESHPNEQADRALRVAARRGDFLVRAEVLLTKALGDVMDGTYPRAYVLAGQALETAEHLGARHLGGMSAAVEGLVEMCLDSTADLARLEEYRDWSGDVADLEAVMGVARCRQEGRCRRIQRAGRCPAAALPLLLIAIRSCDEVSDLVREVLPEDWLKDIDAFARRWRRLSGGQGDLGLDERPGGDCLEVHMLGGFGVRRNGKSVPKDGWRRKASRTLLELLMVSPQHEASRSLVCEALWPQSDLVTARNNIYSVMSVLRRAIGQRRDGTQFVILDNGYVRMATDCLRCDIDDFRAIAAEVLADDGDDLACVRACCELEGRFPGNIVVPPSDPTGTFAKCHDELAALYADAMIAGSEAAVRIGKATIAVRLARNASSVSPLREDIEECILKALITAGRIQEARSHYEAYARNAIAEAGVPPSTRLRRMVREMCEGGGETGWEYYEDDEYRDS